MFKSGLVESAGQMCRDLLGHQPHPVTTAAVVLGATFIVTLFTSNTATGELMIPLSIGLTQAMGVSPDRAVAIVMGVAMVASLGVTFPAATPPVAVVTAYAHVKRSEVTRFGAVVDTVSLVLVFALVVLMMLS